MMRGAEFEVLHGAVDLIQTHEQWDGNMMGHGFSGSNNSIPATRPVTDCRYGNGGRFELSEWVEQVVKRLSETPPETVDGFPADTVSPDNFHGEWRARKSARREFAGGTLCGEDQLHWSTGPGGQQPSSDESNKVAAAALTRFDDQGLSLLTLLLECAVAISVENLTEANRMLLELTQLASPYGPSCAERVVAYFAKAMASRVMNSWLGICSPLITYKHILSAFQSFNNVSPFVKFSHFTSNQAILEAFHQRDRVHIIDLDIMQGLQWPALFHILATRLEGPPRIRMTGLGTSMDLLQETGRQLSSFAKRLGMSFEFHPIARKFGELEASTVQVRRGETVAVHWLQHSLFDATGPDWKTMKLLEQLQPRVITLVEQDISHVGSFLDRFVGSLHYYSTMFDSLGATLPADDPNRYRVEHYLLSREINNILAIGGPSRSGQDKFQNWRMELARRGFMQVPMSGNSTAQAQLILNMFPPSHGYTILQGDGTLRLGWKEISLYTASAWTSHASQ
ncbi:scarecrow-like protein 23 [Aristolochia californica]|uniref:scarecrow-like protein 23 n=1 Tax=Aristolochia californica TaxID=171875 RepID=UPI0035E3904E